MSSEYEISDYEFFQIDNEIFVATTLYVEGGPNSGYVSMSYIYRYDGSIFQHFQSIPTRSARDWESFVINGETYIVVANYADVDNHAIKSIDSKIYKYHGNTFQEFQSIPTNGAWHWRFFMIGGEAYLVVAHYHDGTSHSTDSKIFKYNGNTFQDFQNIPTNGAKGWEFFEINNEAYLVVANFNEDSKIYKYDGAQFQYFQTISTNGASGWDFFVINSDAYLVVANVNGDSKIYKYNGNGFINFQTISPNGAVGWKSFEINNVVYLVVAYQQLDSKIYKYDGNQFLHFQNIVTNGAWGWSFFKNQINSEFYLAVATYAHMEVGIYKWTGVSCHIDACPLHYSLKSNYTDLHCTGHECSPTYDTDRCCESNLTEFY